MFRNRLKTSKYKHESTSTLTFSTTFQKILVTPIVTDGRGSRVVCVSDRGLPCHEFESSTTKDPPCRAVMHVKSVES
ncbi:UNVERIFIED_CONTAM: hypothetical protein NCL1_13483 [Trichonephila clavipes]